MLMTSQNISSPEIPVNPFLKESPPVNPVGQFDLPKRSVPYSCLNPVITPQGSKVKLHECRCGSQWCSRCRSKALGAFHERLKGMNWKRVRHLMLSIDPKKFESGEEAYIFIVAEEIISGLIRNLKRTIKVKVVDWVYSLEFHDSGFPHWHIMIEVGEEGFFGQIGKNNIKKYWPWGEYIREDFIRDEAHWKRLTAYFGSKGYFGEDEKKHQLSLPEWAQGWSKKIRRWNGMGHKKLNSQKKENMSGRKRVDVKPMRSYKVILNECGRKSRIEFAWNFKSDKWLKGGNFRIVDVSVFEINGGFEYVKGEGWVREMNVQELEGWVKGHNNLKHLWYDFQPYLFDLKVGDLSY